MRTFLGTLFGAVHSPVEPVKIYVTERGAVIVGLYLLTVAVGQAALIRQVVADPAVVSEALPSAEPATPADVSMPPARAAEASPPSVRQPSVVQAAAQEGDGSPQGQPAPAPDVNAQPAPGPAGDGAGPVDPDADPDAADDADRPGAPEPVAPENPPPGADVRFTTALAASTGALGGTLHAARSLYWYSGNRTLAASWIPMYLMKPLTSALLATIVCLVLGGGLWTDGPSQNNAMQIMAVAALVGLFSDEAAEKLKQIANAIFSPKEHGKDHEHGTRTAVSIIGIAPVSPAHGTAAQPLTVTMRDCRLPVVAWVTNPAAQSSVYTTTADPNVDDAIQFQAVLDRPGAWTVRLTDRDGQTTDAVTFTVT